jgi:NADH-quinone oxidoreductase subunit J
MRAWLYLLAAAVAGAIITTPGILVFLFAGGSFDDALLASLGTLMLASGLAVVTMRDIIRCGLAMIVCFLALAGIYVVVGAPLVAAAQVIVYIVAVLITLGVASTDWSEIGQRVRLGTSELARILFQDYVLPFEIVSVLLLAAVIGGVFIAKREPDAGAD